VHGLFLAVGQFVEGFVGAGELFSEGKTASALDLAKLSEVEKFLFLGNSFFAEEHELSSLDGDGVPDVSGLCRFHVYFPWYS
jgi:hypothetical protein